MGCSSSKEQNLRELLEKEREIKSKEELYQKNYEILQSLVDEKDNNIKLQNEIFRI